MAKIYYPGYGCVGLVSVKIGRNSKCSCGSGEKAKKCCGAETKYQNRNFESIDELRKRLEYWENEREILKNLKNYRMTEKLERANEKIKDLTEKINYSINKEKK